MTQENRNGMNRIMAGLGGPSDERFDALRAINFVWGDRIRPSWPSADVCSRGWDPRASPGINLILRGPNGAGTIIDYYYAPALQELALSTLLRGRWCAAIDKQYRHVVENCENSFLLCPELAKK